LLTIEITRKRCGSVLKSCFAVLKRRLSALLVHGTWVSRCFVVSIR